MNVVTGGKLRAWSVMRLWWVEKLPQIRKLVIAGDSRFQIMGLWDYEAQGGDAAHKNTRVADPSEVTPGKIFSAAFPLSNHAARQSSSTRPPA